MTDDRRATLEAIAYGNDPGIRPADRVRAIELLTHLPGDPVDQTARLTPEQVAAELEAFGMPAASAVAAGPDGVLPPAEGELDVLRRQAKEAEKDRDAAVDDRDQLKEVARRAFEELLGDDEPDAEAILQAWRLVHAEDSTAADVDVVVEGLPLDRYTHGLSGSEAATAAKLQAFLDRSVGDRLTAEAR